MHVKVRRITEYKEGVKKKILEEIIASGKNGIYQKDLIEKIYNKSDGRTSVYEHTKKLKAEGLIRIIRDGNRVRYVATSRTSIDMQTIGHILGKRFVTFDFGKGIGKKGAIINIPEGVEIDESNAEYYRKMAEPTRFTHNLSIEKALCKLSMQIGGYFIYNLIQSMNLDNFSSILRSQYPRRKVDSILKEEKNRHMYSDIWIRSTIASHIKRFKSGFRHVLRRYGYIPDLTTTEGRKRDMILGDYLLGKEATELLDVLYKAHPYLFKLEKYRNELINKREDIEWYQNRMKYLRGR